MRFHTVNSLENEKLDAVIVPVFKEADAASSATGELRKQAKWVAQELGEKKIFTATTHLTDAYRLVVVNAGQRDDFDLQRAWQIASAGVKALWNSTAKRIAICVDTGSIDSSSAIQSAVEGAIYSMWRPETYRTNGDDRSVAPIDEVLILAGEDVDGADEAIRRGTAIADGVNWARSQANEPANRMTPTILANAARELANGKNGGATLELQVLDEKECEALGMGSFLSVARGSDEPAKLIVLRYRGRTGDGFDLGLVGKGITFDSGGISIKHSEDMHLMKYDMAGAATVLATASVVAGLGLRINLIAVAPTTENLPGGHATKPGDIVTSMSGKTVEVINTDAEGRLVLIDGVTYAQREGAVRVVDVATLTGAVRVALGRHYTGLFGRPEGFVEQIRQAGERAGERLWPLPLSDEYREEMKSDIADLKNSGSRLGGAILGAAFIDAAVEPQTEWAHLDIASTAWFEEDRPFAPKGPQGPMVRTLVELASNIAARGR